MFLLHYLLQMLLTDGGVTVHALKCLGCLCLSSHDWWGAAAGSLLPGIVRPERCCSSTVWEVSIHNLTYSTFSVRHLFIIVINFAHSQMSEDNFQELVEDWSAWIRGLWSKDSYLPTQIACPRVQFLCLTIAFVLL